MVGHSYRPRWTFRILLTVPRAPLDHTADTGLEATATSFSALVVELATGMFDLMARVDPCPRGTPVETIIAAATHEELVVDSLSELLYRSEIEGLHLCHFDIEEYGESSVRIRAAGVPTEDVTITGPAIKAVTYHQLEVSEADDGWHARVYFDV